MPEISDVIAQFDQLGLTGNAAEIRELNKLNDEWTDYNFCPLRLTGSSPTLIGYDTSGQVYEVKVGRKIVYLNTNSDNTVYYEYLPVSFNKPDEGWDINKSALKQFAQKIGGELGLNDAEVVKLSFELNLASAKITSNNLFVGLISQEEVNQKVPLKVTPSVPTFRYHFYISKAGSSVIAPVLTPVSRSGSMVLEVGAVAR
ncbi:hypothetical protein A2W14_01495 [Candidatus Gottesmanbacteria bacterium RBG_16_37_8]|uniref:Uncharacterized protein n=1 Tax=Candidatus Gottesmanbacteria bacterium RBG_16_37_8 TaxID=1798371 RepID=A0A1F5YPP1_9BACT|nr:MAG: hypothetical protein A2W14_01495 [Candidatus Gottesmanbacteria bacterium RBG_16_37_8]